MCGPAFCMICMWQGHFPALRFRFGRLSFEKPNRWLFVWLCQTIPHPAGDFLPFGPSHGSGRSSLKTIHRIVLCGFAAPHITPVPLLSGRLCRLPACSRFRHRAAFPPRAICPPSASAPSSAPGIVVSRAQPGAWRRAFFTQNDSLDRFVRLRRTVHHPWAGPSRPQSPSASRRRRRPLPSSRRLRKTFPYRKRRGQEYGQRFK